MVFSKTESAVESKRTCREGVVLDLLANVEKSSAGRILKSFPGPGCIEFDLPRKEPAEVPGNGEDGAFRALARNKIEDTADGARAIDRRQRAAHNLYLFD